MKKYILTRTTFNNVGEIGLPHVGIYLIAYLGKILYIGKSSDGIETRINQHRKSFSPIGQWLSMVTDNSNIRLDIIEPPNDCKNQKQWLMEYENRLIKRFQPLLNLQLIP